MKLPRYKKKPPEPQPEPPFKPGDRVQYKGSAPGYPSDGLGTVGTHTFWDYDCWSQEVAWDWGGTSMATSRYLQRIEPEAEIDRLEATWEAL